MRTARLDGAPLTVAAHGDALARWEADPRVGETMGGVRTRAESLATTARLAADWEREPFGLMGWTDRACGAVVARGGIRWASLEGVRVVEVGWMVDPDRWGEGFAAELGAASIAHGFAEHGLPEILSWTIPANARSRRVMVKLGMAYLRDATYAGLPHVVYRLGAL